MRVNGAVSWRRGARGRVCRAGGVPVYGGESGARRPGEETRRSWRLGGVHCEVAAGVTLRYWRGRVRAWGARGDAGPGAGYFGAEHLCTGVCRPLAWGAMKPAAAHSLLLRSLCLALCCLGGARASWRSGNHEWKKLIMVHHWPVTVCKEVEHDCRDPPDYWTIHGLWPDKAEECNGSWPFNLEEIKDLLPKMKMYWPDVIHPLNHSHFWKHEWEKHGTCAAQVDTLNSEKKYFGRSLDLYQQLELNRTKDRRSGGTQGHAGRLPHAGLLCRLSSQKEQDLWERFLTPEV